MADAEVLLFERRGPIAVLTMNRPERRNAMNLAMIEALAAAWDRIEADDAIRVAVLTGAGEAYCVGGDLREGWMTGGSGEDRPRPSTATITRGLLLSAPLVKPLVAAVNGDALGGGCEMLQQTDIRVAEEQARFGLPEVQRGLVPGAGSMVRLKRQIPYTRAMEMILTGDPLTAAEAREVGLVGRVVPRGEALPTAIALAERVAANGPLAVRNAKRAVIESGWLAEEDALAIERRLTREVMSSSDAREGLRAFGERRTPDFTGH
ncbi:enoyl-CoA hydratase-related protein [Nocardioides sp. W7]|uniref:enoyl-CoA hydratase-related protein n=1 Tax=Nocardioides sp. W7 TaxID=2931390 RepID=UPI001FD455E1|nr:enoyl-CoA hydratase-related protein [Nocardioides sp. W7]